MLVALDAILQVAAAAAIEYIGDRQRYIAGTFMLVGIVIVGMATGAFGFISTEWPAYGGAVACMAVNTADVRQVVARVIRGIVTVWDHWQPGRGRMTAYAVQRGDEM